MEPIHIRATEHTPKVVINSDNIYEGITIEISGESVPEDTRKFYAPVFNWLESLKSNLGDEKYATGKGITIILNFRMKYFNSSSAKIFIMLMETLSELKIKYSEMGTTINWLYNDEDVRESGEEFKSLVAVPFNVIQNHLLIKGSKNSPEIIISPEKNFLKYQANLSLKIPVNFTLQY